MGSVEAADCRGHDHHAGAGWEGEHGSWVGEVEAHGTVQGPRVPGAGARAPGVRQRTLLPSCGGG